jgi:hypothetical protein
LCSLQGRCVNIAIHRMSSLLISNVSSRAKNVIHSLQWPHVHLCTSCHAKIVSCFAHKYHFGKQPTLLCEVKHFSIDGNSEPTANMTYFEYYWTPYLSPFQSSSLAQLRKPITRISQNLTTITLFLVVIVVSFHKSSLGSSFLVAL